jgi:myotubularin-related protein 1/2
MNIPNIHAMRESMKKLKALCLSPSCDNLQWLGNIEDTKWLYYIRQLLKSALHITSLLRDGESVLLHCSHGWDRTSQLSALAQLFLDPFYRTWKGFQILIEKEWLSFGHPFQLRLSHGEKADSQESPIFLQFLDCVYQLVRLFPSYFEFNEGLLLVLVDALYSCRFGTFLLDCRKLRHEADLPNRTASVWTWVNGLRSFLTEETFVDNQVLAPPVSVILKNATLWNDVYMRWSVQHFTPHDPIKLKQNFTQDHTRILSWQLPQGTRRVLNEKLASKYQEAKILQRLRDRIAELEKN